MNCRDKSPDESVSPISKIRMQQNHEKAQRLLIAGFSGTTPGTLTSWSVAWRLNGEELRRKTTGIALEEHWDSNWIRGSQ